MVRNYNVANKMYTNEMCMHFLHLLIQSNVKFTIFIHIEFKIKSAFVVNIPTIAAGRYILGASITRSILQNETLIE